MDIANVFCRLLAGFNFKECSTLDAMEVNTLPILFVHGEADTFVPARFTRENYETCRAEKELITVPGAGHGMSYLLETEKCQKALSAFLEKHSTFTPGDEAEEIDPDVFEQEQKTIPEEI